jgi:hypothetical protein
VESDHAYSAYPGASVRDVRAAASVYEELESFAQQAKSLTSQEFDAEFKRMLLRTQNMLGTFGTLPD